MRESPLFRIRKKGVIMSKDKQRQKLMEHYGFSEKDLKRIKKWSRGKTPKKWFNDKVEMERVVNRYEQLTNDQIAILFPTND